MQIQAPHTHSNTHTPPQTHTYTPPTEDIKLQLWTEGGRTLRQVEETGWEDSRAQEAQEDGGTDQVVAEVLLPFLSAVLAEVGEHLTQFTGDKRCREVSDARCRSIRQVVCCRQQGAHVTHTHNPTHFHSTSEHWPHPHSPTSPTTHTVSKLPWLPNCEAASTCVCVHMCTCVCVCALLSLLVWMGK